MSSFCKLFQNLLCDKICWTLFNCDLLEGRKKASFSYTTNALGIIFIIVEKVDFLRGFDHCWMEVQHLKQGPGASFPHSNDNGLGKLLDQVMKVYLLSAELPFRNSCSRPCLNCRAQGEFSLTTGSESARWGRWVVACKQQRDNF